MLNSFRKLVGILIALTNLNDEPFAFAPITLGPNCDAAILMNLQIIQSFESPERMDWVAGSSISTLEILTAHLPTAQALYERM